MGINNLPKLASAPTKVEATTTQYNTMADALHGHQVMRDSSGVIEDGVSDIGRPNSGRPKKIYVSEGIVINGQTLNTSPFLLSRTGIQSGLSKTSGFPQFLEPGDETGAGGGHFVRILAEQTALEMTIDGQSYTLESDLESDDLALAPSSNNTCLVNDANISADPAFSKTIGEYGYWIRIDTIGSEIETLTDTVQSFKISNGSETEVFIAKIEADNTGADVNRLIPILRGVGGTKRIAFSDNDTITLLKTHYIFLDNDLTTVNTSINYPTWSASEPSSPTEGDYWWDVINKTWKRYSGATWETLGRIYLGYAIADSSGVQWVEHMDFDLAWDDLLEFQEYIYSGTTFTLRGGLNISVAGTLLTFPREKLTATTANNIAPGETWNNTDFFYVYISSQGNLYFSNKIPRTKDYKRGFYHPSEYWRCIAIIRYSATSPTCYSHNAGVLQCEMNSDALTGGWNGAWQKVFMDIPPLIQAVEIKFNKDTINEIDPSIRSIDGIYLPYDLGDLIGASVEYYNIIIPFVQNSSIEMTHASSNSYSLAWLIGLAWFKF